MDSAHWSKNPALSFHRIRRSRFSACTKYLRGAMTFRNVTFRNVTFGNETFGTMDIWDRDIQDRDIRDHGHSGPWTFGTF